MGQVELMETVSTSFFSIRKCCFIKIDMFRGMVSILTKPSLRKCQSGLFPPSRFVPINSKSSAPIKSNFLRIMSVCPLQRGICWEAGWRRDRAALHVAPLQRPILLGDLFAVFAPRTRHRRGRLSTGQGGFRLLRSEIQTRSWASNWGQPCLTPRNLP